MSRANTISNNGGMKSCACKMAGVYFSLCRFAERYANPLLLLAIRLFMADVFLRSGLLKLENWQSTITLFKYEHPVPYLPVEVAAFMGTAGEIILPIMLIIGLGARFGAAGLLIMTAVIELTYKHFDVHYMWALLLLVVLIQGAGKWSLDNIIKRKCC